MRRVSTLLLLAFAAGVAAESLHTEAAGLRFAGPRDWSRVPAPSDVRAAQDRLPRAPAGCARRGPDWTRCWIHSSRIAEVRGRAGRRSGARHRRMVEDEHLVDDGRLVLAHDVDVQLLRGLRAERLRLDSDQARACVDPGA